jgi:hypothetical protein
MKHTRRPLLIFVVFVPLTKAMLSVLSITSASRTRDPPVANSFVIYSSNPVVSAHAIVTNLRLRPCIVEGLVQFLSFSRLMICTVDRVGSERTAAISRIWSNTSDGVSAPSACQGGRDPTNCATLLKTCSLCTLVSMPY